MIVQTDHPLVNNDRQENLEDFVLGLIHRKAYKEVRGLARGGSVLDWGCNDGYGLEMLAPYAASLAGLDTGAHCVGAAKRRLPWIADRIRQYDGECFPFGTETFDLVISFQVIEHVSNVDLFLRGVRLALANRGTAVFTTPNRLIRLDPGMKPWNSFHVTEFSGHDLKQVLCGHFAEVTVLGLQGKPHLVDIEKRRCDQARRAAGRPDREIAEHVPDSAARPANSTRRESISVLGQARRQVGRLGLGRLTWPLLYNTGQLDYSPQRVDEAVDVMAICRLPRIDTHKDAGTAVPNEAVRSPDSTSKTGQQARSN